MPQPISRQASLVTGTRTPKGRRSRVGGRAADRERNRPTPERMRQGAMVEQRIEAPDGLAAIVHRAGHSLGDDLTQDQRDAADRVRWLVEQADAAAAGAVDPGKVRVDASTRDFAIQTTTRAQRAATAMHVLDRLATRAGKKAWAALLAALAGRPLSNGQRAAAILALDRIAG